MHPWPGVEPRGDLQSLYLGGLRERRRSVRIALRLAVAVYDASRCLGRFWTRDVSQVGLYLHADRTDRLTGTILRLRFEADCAARFLLRGAAVREVQGEGVGVQLAFWRSGDEAAHAAYRQLIDRRGRGSADRRFPMAKLDRS